jgi:hypothetical protein
MWVEEDFKLFFVETHEKLMAATQHEKVKQTIKDVLSLVTIEGQQQKE